MDAPVKAMTMDSQMHATATQSSMKSQAKLDRYVHKLCMFAQAFSFENTRWAKNGLCHIK